MRWIDLPAIAEFEDRSGVVRKLYGCTILGRYEFADRLADITQILSEIGDDLLWAEEYRKSARLRAAIDGALACWGLQSEWLSISQIEALLLYREIDGELKQGWLVELLDTKKPDARESGCEPMGLAGALAAISTHCEGLMEAIDLAANVPGDLLLEALAAKAEIQKEPREERKVSKEKLDFIKQNFDKLMAGRHG
jgi:hypothetical protein